MNVAVVKTGPGVIWPTAIASSSWAFAQPVPAFHQIRP